MHNATTSPAVTPVREAIGSATVAEIREMLGGQTGNTDRALLVRVNRWFRENDWETGWSGPRRQNEDRTVGVDWDVDNREIGVTRRGPYSWMPTDSYPVTSVRGAVDTLVLEGVLPVSFSSMYAAGRASLAPERAA